MLALPGVRMGTAGFGGQSGLSISAVGRVVGGTRWQE